ncbi:SpaH/EbpB family LPXTG-anchored major pilin [Glutamicibacter sp.]|uniref:SpaH/EbpB family LPXTG-anchored major pilin n=1 Tax=Glutamicibacter sp. TaxID=1931995 RepID=UPI002B46A343|nr:SpaH/EbpB family LPXTG-anchored major pilin [Glutamicibacter sp.]HJX78639.1 SpaH/EbpB family LPXTG-anchored major pilin [Glutamicibacter sp.]
MSLTTRRASRGLRRIAVSLGALLAGTSLVLTAAIPASAAQNIDPDATGSITVHKFEEPTTPTGLDNNGTAIDTSGLTPISGVTFTAQQVDIDLTDDASWQGLENYTVAQAQSNLRAGTERSQVTGANGIAGFAGLPVGLYLVTESSVGENNIPVQGEPFLVTMPLAVDNDWLYDVNVYPKNTVTGLEKTVDDSAAYVIGDPVNFSFTARVPSVPASQPMTAFGISDTLDSRLQFESATVTVAGANLVAGDYTIGATGQQFELSFTAAGLTKLRAVQGNIITVNMATTVQSLGNGAITNQGQIYVNDPESGYDSNTVKSSWGALQLQKYAAEDESLFLTGAEFQLYAVNAEGGRTTGPLQDVTDSNDTFTTGADGTFTINGLKAGTYELVETKAPLGYKLDAAPIAVTVNEGSLAQAAQVSVSNDQVPPFQLPLTGSTGTAIFVGAGLVLVAGGILLATARKRRSQAN